MLSQKQCWSLAEAFKDSLSKYGTTRKDIGIGTLTSNFILCKDIINFYGLDVEFDDNMKNYRRIIRKQHKPTFYSELKYDRKLISLSSFFSPILPLHEAAHRAFAIRYNPESINDILYNDPTNEIEYKVNVITAMFLKRCGFNLRMYFTSIDENTFLLQEELISIPFTSRFMNKELEFI